MFRSRQLPDDRARQRAVDLVSAATLASHSGTQEAHDLSHQSAQQALTALEAVLAPIAEHTVLDLAGPSGSGVDLPLDVATTARAVSRGLLLAGLERPGLTRLR